MILHEFREGQRQSIFLQDIALKQKRWIPGRDPEEMNYPSVFISLAIGNLSSQKQTFIFSVSIKVL